MKTIIGALIIYDIFKFFLKVLFRYVHKKMYGIEPQEYRN